jgi:hypothetical protein
MSSVLDYVKRHHVGLLALVLVLSGGTAYAAKVHLPKNTVGSKQVKNGSLRAQDLKPGTITGASVGDGSLTGADLADGSITAQDLAPTAVAASRVLLVTDTSGGDPATVFSQPAVGSLTFACGPGASDVLVTATLAAEGQPGSAKIIGSDIVDQQPVGASTVSAASPVGHPVSVDWAATGVIPPDSAVIPEGWVYFDTPTKRVAISWDVSGCTFRGLLVVSDRAAQPGLNRTARGRAARPVCQAVGVGSCDLHPGRS